MSKKANPTLVGGFVVGAAALILAGIVVVGSGELFQEQFRCVAYFDESVAKLDVGAPIRFKGVRVGTVSTIRAVWTDESDDEETPVRIPVGLTFVSGAVHAPSKAIAERLEELGPYAVMDEMIGRGLRAVLQQDSFVTGKLFVALQFAPDAPLRRVGDGEVYEIPTIPGGFARLEKSLQDLPLDEVLEQAITTMKTIEERVKDPEIDRVLGQAGDLLAELDRNAGSLTDAVSAALESVESLARSADAEVTPAMREFRELLDRLGTDLGRLSESASGALDEARGTLRTVNELGGEYALGHRLTTLLDELTETARSLRGLADYLERHPEALLHGKTER